ncbi:uncharacterized protein NECHADRAFT_79491 [Fusarium vanettenii 77-13-4]|uniref:DUF4419 domain-containing protein n=1 Tax=Fusarium vanettenii (strain ATCC MYA-4622 / CBS 123669 / FGSC 9596 / NRRL 45880 / 77-13-4) TaxID=660122 RepID=C7YP08_FUSV7|nr:uncharacterized protein NECHADRAFT_79491 [Fusarium vanettenii 77-13-4]EEU46208.1 hypothetical protein NECHADRAFT_79491 [Fusarium vanettenii 77-13-4]
MPVTIYPADHPAAPRQNEGSSTESGQVFERACPDEYKKGQRIIQSSFDKAHENLIHPAKNSFVNAVWEAYNNHHHLFIRPEDVWFSILTQLSFYINKNAEKLRSHFVRHEGKKKVAVRIEGTLDCAELARLMTERIEDHIFDPKLREWIMPDDFSTAEAPDNVTALILMMGSMQEYFSCTADISCGLPSVTLLGYKTDWNRLKKRLDKIAEFGEEAELFAKLLRPVLHRFDLSFMDPKDPDILDFWGKIAHWEQKSSGPDSLSGWISAFCFWTAEGTCLYSKGLDKTIPDPETGGWRAGCILDGVQFHHIDIEEIPKGFVSVPVKLVENLTEHKTRMVAASVGVKAWSSGDLISAALPRPEKETITPRAETPEETIMPRAETPKETEKKKVSKVARLREFVLRLITLPGRDAGVSTSKESPDNVTVANEPQATTVDEPPQAPDTVSKPEVSQEDSKAKLDSFQPVSGWWMYELKDGQE